MPGWNYADVFESVAAAVGDRPCQIQGDRLITWREFDRRANALAADLLAAGPRAPVEGGGLPVQRPGVPRELRRRVQSGRRPVNTNYRYGPEEIVYLFDNADAEAVVFHACFAELIERRAASPGEGEALVRGGRRDRARPGLGRRRTSRWWRPAPTGWSPRGAEAVTICSCCTPAAPPECPRV